MNDQRTPPPPRTGDAAPAAPPSDAPPEPTRAPRGGASVGWGIALITAGLLWVLATLGVTIPWEVILPAGIILVGVALLTGVGGARRGALVGLGVTLTVIAFVAASVPAVSFTAGERQVVVDAATDLEAGYEHGAGMLHIDLSDVTLDEGTTQLRAAVTFGELVVIVPPDATVTGEAAVRIGEVSAFDESRAGILPRISLDRPGADDGPTLDLDLEVGFGTISVRR